MGGLVQSIFGGGKEPQVIIREVDVDNSSEQDEEARRKRASSGYSNIKTSTKGILDELPTLPKRKTLLGE